MPMEFPYLTRKAAGGSVFNFQIHDEIARLWYDTPPSEVINDAVTFVADRQQALHWPEMDIIREHIAIPGATLVDCGCHHGLTTILFAGWVGNNGYVHAFDAVLKNACVAEQNLRINQITNASVYCAGISGGCGFASMQNEGNVILREFAMGAPTTMVIQLSKFFHRAAPDAIKIDIEGAELEMIEADHEFLGAIKRIAIEIHSDYLPPNGIHRIAALLAARPLYVLEEGEQLAPYRLDRHYDRRCHLFSW